MSIQKLENVLMKDTNELLKKLIEQNAQLIAILSNGKISSLPNTIVSPSTTDGTTSFKEMINPWDSGNTINYVPAGTGTPIHPSTARGVLEYRNPYFNLVITSFKVMAEMSNPVAISLGGPAFVDSLNIGWRWLKNGKVFLPNIANLPNISQIPIENQYLQPTNTWVENLAFPTFMDWFIYYLEGMSISL